MYRNVKYYIFLALYIYDTILLYNNIVYGKNSLNTNRKVF